jgi:steroid delta-isomerase-like uncharacterized protein
MNKAKLAMQDTGSKIYTYDLLDDDRYLLAQVDGQKVLLDAVFHVPGRPEPVRGPSGYLEIIGMMRGGFPDIQWKLEEMIAEGDMVAARFTMRGTHNGAFFGVPPTGRKIEAQAMNFYRFSGGKIVEERGQPDLLGLLQQIGAIPM